jgi:hypothetical protein
MCHFNNQTLRNPSTGDEAKSALKNVVLEVVLIFRSQLGLWK